MKSRYNIWIVILGIAVAVLCLVYSSKHNPQYSDLGKLKVRFNAQQEMLDPPVKKSL